MKHRGEKFWFRKKNKYSTSLKLRADEVGQLCNWIELVGNWSLGAGLQCNGHCAQVNPIIGAQPSPPPTYLCPISNQNYWFARSLGARWAPTSSLRSYGPPLGPSGFLWGNTQANTLSMCKHTIYRLIHYPSINTLSTDSRYPVLTHYQSVSTLSKF